MISFFVLEVWGLFFFYYQNWLWCRINLGFLLNHKPTSVSAVSIVIIPCWSRDYLTSLRSCSSKWPFLLLHLWSWQRPLQMFLFLSVPPTTTSWVSFPAESPERVLDFRPKTDASWKLLCLSILHLQCNLHSGRSGPHEQFHLRSIALVCACGKLLGAHSNGSLSRAWASLSEWAAEQGFTKARKTLRTTEPWS